MGDDRSARRRLMKKKPNRRARNGSRGRNVDAKRNSNDSRQATTNEHSQADDEEAKVSPVWPQQRLKRRRQKELAREQGRRRPSHSCRMLRKKTPECRPWRQQRLKR
jgi:hypothetical protein